MPLLVLVGVVASLLLWAWYPLHQTLPFGDEAEHVVLGWQMLEHNHPLYSQLSTNHQPIPIYLGGILAHSIQFQVLFDFISGLRLAMWMWWVVWGMAIVVRFGVKGLIAWACAVVAAPLLLGFYVLAESLVAPAIVYLVLLLSSRGKVGNTSSRLDLLVSLLLLLFIFLSHASSWLFVVGCGAILSYTYRTRLIVPAIIVGVIGFAIVGYPIAWFEETVRNVALYFVPFMHGDDSLLLWIFKLLYPFVSFFHLHQPLGLMVTVLALPVMFGLFHAPFRGYRLVVAVVLLLNTRLDSFEHAYYGGFHLYPLLAGLSGLVVWNIPSNFSSKLALGMGMCIVIAAPWVWFSPNRSNTFNDYMVSYGDAEAYGKAIHILKAPGDELFAGEFGGYMTLVAKLPLYADQHALLPWSWQVPKLQDRFVNKIASELPAFVYFDNDSNPFFTHWKTQAEDNYLQLRRSDGGDTRLYVLQSRLLELDQTTWEKFESEAFLLPSINNETGLLEYPQ